MKLLVCPVEARNLRAMDLNGSSDPYVRLQLGKQKFKTKVVKKSLNPSWGEEFNFQVEGLNGELIVSVLDENKYLGQLKVLVSNIFYAENNSLGTTWYTLQPKNKKSKNRDLGEILLTISLLQLNSERLSCNGDNAPHVEKCIDITSESSSRSLNSPLRSSLNSPLRSSINSLSRSSLTMGTEGSNSSKEEKSHAHNFPRRLAQIFHKNGETTSTSTSTSTRGLTLSDLSADSEVHENKFEDWSSDSTFDEAMRSMESNDEGREIPSNLPGGILLDQSYAVAPRDLNNLLFSPDSQFSKSLAEMQGTTELQQGPWRFENDGKILKRIVTYLMAATKFIKAAKAIEEQVCLKADGRVFAVTISVSTPDVMYGSTFKMEMLYCITPGPELPSGEQSSHLVISWRVNFLQSTMMRGMIEGGVKQGLKSSFERFADLLSQNVKLVDLKDLGSNKEQVLASLHVEPHSDWELATQYFLNFTAISTIFIVLYVLTHILLGMPSTIQGLEFTGLDLPDSIGEVIVCGILVIQGQRVLEMIARFMQARTQKGSDHGVKALGDGWLLTVALIEGTSIAAVDSTGFSDPYVVFTCNGKTRTSSIKFQKPDPQWNEIFEFDAMDEPPSKLEVEVFDFDGPFDEATSLGHAEVNFVKSSLSDLVDAWIPLQGKLAQACQSKLHLRIFLNNTKGSNVVKEYLAKMEKEVGKKINVRSPQTNSAFQKLFGLPPEEFLINDFTCHLKRKLPLQGRLFLSARIIGFHTNMFGHKTKFFFLWEDIEDIRVLPPTLSSMGSPPILIILRRGRGMDARHGAKTQDEEGRLKFLFHFFGSFNVAHRTIMALWKARSLSPEQKVQIVEEQSEGKSLQTEDSESFLGLEDASMSEVHTSSPSVPMCFFMELFSGGYLERKVMAKLGCLDYSHTPWELVKPNIHQRQISYKFDKHISRYGGEVTSTQQRSLFSDRNGWVIEEVMTLHGIPFGENFTLHIRYQVEDIPSKSNSCNVQVFFGIVWLKSTRNQKRITKNIISNLANRLKVKYSLIEKEVIPAT